MKEGADTPGQVRRPRTAIRLEGAPPMTLVQLDAAYLRYIEELERQVAELERELAECRAQAAEPGPGPRGAVDEVPLGTPPGVTADGTRGMVRGVSGSGLPARGSRPKR